MMDFIVIVIGMIPIGASIFLVFEAEGREDRNLGSGIIAAALLFFGGIALMAGIRDIGTEEWYVWFLVSGVLFVLAYIFYRSWKG